MTVWKPMLVAGATLLAVPTATVQTSPRAPFDRIVAFGTSLSDPGNAFALRGGTDTPPDYWLDPLFVPQAPYARGGHHFSNGATWVELFARSLGLAGNARPALASNGDGTNFAVAAARACDDGLNFNLSAQVDEFLQRVGDVAPSDALYAIEIGGNDIRDAIVAFPSRHSAILQCAVISVGTNITRLYAAGARRFIVWRAPDLGLTPAIGILDRINPGAKALATALSEAFNQGLDGAVAQLALLPGINMKRLDAFRLLHDIVNAPSAFGLTNVASPCVTPNIPPFMCDTPDEFLFWDGIHPSAVAHALIASEAASVLLN